MKKADQGVGLVESLAESVIGLFKTEVIRREGPWRSLEDVEYATLAWVAWCNTQRLLEPLGYLPPAEYEEASTVAKSLTPSWRHSHEERF